MNFSKKHFFTFILCAGITISAGKLITTTFVRTGISAAHGEETVPDASSPRALQPSVGTLDPYGFYAWNTVCNTLPPYQKGIENPCKTVLESVVFGEEITHFFDTMAMQFKSTYWIDGRKPAINASEFQAYAQKLIVPDNAIIAIHGDLHGDVHSLNRFIQISCTKGFLDKKNPFKIVDSRFYILFLGDYVDRGWYGAEVLYAILRLKNENPDRVFMVRGNHEDVVLNNKYGFAYELLGKFSSDVFIELCNQVYNVLPVVLYLGVKGSGPCDVIQCCHGGVELGFDPTRLLENTSSFAGMKFITLMKANGFKSIMSPSLKSFQKYFHNNVRVDEMNGFMWNDFIVDPVPLLSLSSRDGYIGTVFSFGKESTHKILEAQSGKSYVLRSIFRAHQHNCTPMRRRILNLDRLSHHDDRGIGKLWIEQSVHQRTPALLDDVAVVTFSVAPAAGYDWAFHAFGLLQVASRYEDWRLMTVRAEI